ncbi:hypothetical protein EVAR_44208_1 [Eumeta japonica]|uniref:Uncharacterized protein n=1 Tax=Eumeta variegata TaxID=151549 RepID=A0A4C1W1G8_EUMVA|nr:hypothetical protein EVAR_44208_1 [Eumeta japonica]
MMSLNMQVPTNIIIIIISLDIDTSLSGPKLSNKTRLEIEIKAREVLYVINEWGNRNRLDFSPFKLQTMTMRGTIQKLPVIKLSGNSIRTVSSVTVVVVVHNASLSFAHHVASIVEKALRYLITCPNTLLHPGVLDRVDTYVARCTLLRGQRSLRILLTKAYKSVSTAGLPVLAGVLSVDLEMARAGRSNLAWLEAIKAEIMARKRAFGEI